MNHYQCKISLSQIKEKLYIIETKRQMKKKSDNSIKTTQRYVAFRIILVNTQYIRKQFIKHQ